MDEYNVNQTQSDEVSLKDLILKGKEIWAYLWSKWKIILVVGLLGGALGLTYSLLKQKTYLAGLSFSVVEKGSSGGSLASLAGQFGFSLGSGGGSVFSGDNMVELLLSRNMIERTLLHTAAINGKECTLVEYYKELTAEDLAEDDPARNIHFPAGLARENFTREQDSVLNVIRTGLTEGNLSVSKRGKLLDIIDVSFKNEDELFAKIFTETLLDEVSVFYIQIKTRNIKENLDAMELRADSMRNEYEKALVKAAMYSDQNINARNIVSVELVKYRTTVELMGTAYSELTKNIEIMKLDLARQTPVVQIIDSPILPLEEQGLGKKMGIILGGFLGGFLIVGWLLAKYYYRKIMQEPEPANENSTE
jgi:hypothetical protein